jgi:hypothetical protein
MAERQTTDAAKSLTLEQRRQFMRLPLDERRRLMAEQAERMAKDYESQRETAARQHWQGGDIVEW